MKKFHLLDRRHFLKLGTFAASAAIVPTVTSAAPAEVYCLPPLPYLSDALEGFIDTKTMEIHHGKHHASYIKNLNTALATAPDLSGKLLEELLANLAPIPDEALRTTLRNNAGGHWNHDFFWKVLTPANQSGSPSISLKAALDKEFGSMDIFKKAFADAASKRFGSGWVWLIMKNGKLKITSTANQDNPLMKGLVIDSDLGTPLLGLDVWEHAYYLHYQNRRLEYVTAFWNIINWSTVSNLYAATK